MSVINKNIFTGNGGSVYIDGTKEAYVKEIEVKVTGTFSDVKRCGIYKNEAVYTGYNCEGTMTVFMTSTDYATEIMAAFESGIFPSRTIVSNLTNKNTGESAVYSIPNVVYKEITVVKQSEGAIEYSIPFMCDLPEKE